MKIGIFDSGIGGLTVLNAIYKVTNTHIIYVGDTARVPYGTKSKATIKKFASEIVEFLLERGVNLIVVACNTVSSNVLPFLQKIYNAKFIDVIHLPAKEAIQLTKNKKIGVIGTIATIRSHAYENILKKMDRKVQVFSKSCPLFVPLVEEGYINMPATRLIAEEYLLPLKKHEIDTLILGCTHYPLLKPVLKEVMGDEVNFVDSTCVAHEISQLVNNASKSKLEIYFTDIPPNYTKILKNFVEFPLPKIKLLSL